MGETWLVVETGLEEGFIRELGDKTLGGEMVDADLIGAGSRSEVSLRGDGDGIDGLQAGWQRLPGDDLHFFGRGFRALIDPRFEECELLRSQIHGTDFVALWRHLGIPGMRLSLIHI